MAGSSSISLTATTPTILMLRNVKDIFLVQRERQWQLAIGASALVVTHRFLIGVRDHIYITSFANRK